MPHALEKNSSIASVEMSCDFAVFSALAGAQVGGVEYLECETHVQRVGWLWIASRAAAEVFSEEEVRHGIQAIQEHLNGSIYAAYRLDWFSIE